MGELEEFCSRQRDLNKQRGEQILELLGKNHSYQTSLCEKKRELMGYEKSLKSFLNEFEDMRKRPPIFFPWSYESFIDSHCQELQDEASINTLSHSDRFELDVMQIFSMKCIGEIINSDRVKKFWKPIKTRRE